MNKLTNFLKILFRNIMRYKRNYYIMIAIGLGAFFIILLSGVTQGIKQQMLKLMYVNYTGDLMIINRDVKINSDPSPLQVGWDQMITNNGSLERVAHDPQVSKILKRLVLMGSVMGADEKANVYASIIGCDFAQEENTSFKALLKFEKRVQKPHGIYISKKMSEKLNLKIGDDAYLFFVTEAGMVPAKYKVTAIFTGKGFPGIVNSLAYIDYQDLRGWLSLSEEKLSYALVMLKNPGDRAKAKERFASMLPEGWEQVSPEVSGKFILSQGAMYDFVLGISLGLMYISIFLFVYSTLIISIKSRQKEIGIISSMGISSKSIFGLYTCEGMLLGLLPAVIGCLVGLLLVGVFSFIGIPAANEAMRYGIASDVLYLRPNGWALLFTTLGISVIAFLGAVPPTLRILKLKPVEALRDLS